MGLLQKGLREFVESLLANKVEFVVVGAHALAFHGHPRYTQDIDFFVRRNSENAARLVSTLREFGFGSLNLTESDFAEPDQVIQLGMPPNRIDILTQIAGVEFDEAWANRERGDLDGLEVNFVSKADFVKNKLAVGRPKDLADVAALESLL